MGRLEQSPLLQQNLPEAPEGDRKAAGCGRGPMAWPPVLKEQRAAPRGCLDGHCQESGLAVFPPALGSWAPGPGWVCLGLPPPPQRPRVFSDLLLLFPVREIVKTADGREGAALACQNLQWHVGGRPELLSA